METQLEKLAFEALKLTLSERAALAQVLLESLDTDNELDAAWAVEIEQRVVEADNGTGPGIPMAEALAQVRATLT